MQRELQGGNVQLRSRESGRLLEEGTPELVLKEEQGLVKPEGGRLADEMGSDAGWPVTQKDRQQKPVGGNEGLASSQDFTPGSREGLKNGDNPEVCASLTTSCLLLAQRRVWDVGTHRPREHLDYFTYCKLRK